MDKMAGGMTAPILQTTRAAADIYAGVYRYQSVGHKYKAYSFFFKNATADNECKVRHWQAPFTAQNHKNSGLSLLLAGRLQALGKIIVFYTQPFPVIWELCSLLVTVFFRPVTGRVVTSFSNGKEDYRYDGQNIGRR